MFDIVVIKWIQRDNIPILFQLSTTLYCVLLIRANTWWPVKSQIQYFFFQLVCICGASSDPLTFHELVHYISTTALL